MNYFFEPVNLEQWNMFEKVKSIGHIEPMFATQDMKVNDIVLLHVGQHDKTKEPGVYAFGTIIKNPYILRNHPGDYCNNRNTIDLKIQYINYDEPIIKTQENKIFAQYRTVHKLSQDIINEVNKIIPYELLEIMYKDKLDSEIQEIDNELDNSKINIGEREAVVKSRIGQGSYKRLLLKKFDYKCCICKLANIELLVGSHIKEWKDSNILEKGDKNNGLLLCALHDSLFDKHLISFDKNGKIMFSNKLSKEDKEIMHLDENISISLTKDMEKYMEYHRNKV